jgi:hypothetical protein
MCSRRPSERSSSFCRHLRDQNVPALPPHKRPRGIFDEQRATRSFFLSVSLDFIEGDDVCLYTAASFQSDRSYKQKQHDTTTGPDRATNEKTTSTNDDAAACVPFDEILCHRSMEWTPRIRDSPFYWFVRRCIISVGVDGEHMIVYEGKGISSVNRIVLIQAFVQNGALPS